MVGFVRVDVSPHSKIRAARRPLGLRVRRSRGVLATLPTAVARAIVSDAELAGRVLVAEPQGGRGDAVLVEV